MTVMISEEVARPSTYAESEILEFQSDASVHALAPTVTAMLNGRGGLIYVGYSEHGELTGLAGDVPAVAERLTEDLSKVITPKEFFQVLVQEEQGYRGLLIEVPPGSRGPYVYHGRIYVRAGARNQLATAAVLSQMIASRGSQDERWESQLAIGVEPETLNAQEIDSCVNAAEARYDRATQHDAQTNLQGLELLELARDGWPTHAAVILFKTERVLRYRQASVRAASFADEKMAIFVDEQLISGGAFSIFDRLYAFIQHRLPRTSYLPTNGLRRVDMPAYPEWVIREALVNALIHRDYQDQATIQVRMFPDRLEIWNPGGFPPEFAADPAAQTISRPRNPDIARTFHLRGYADLLGIGLRRMRQQMAEAVLPPPQWRNEGGGVMLTLSRQQPMQAGNLQPADMELLPRHITFLAASRPGDKYTRDYYQSQFAPEISERSARNDLRLLRERGYLRQSGRGYNTLYVRTDKPLGADALRD